MSYLCHCPIPNETPHRCGTHLDGNKVPSQLKMETRCQWWQFILCHRWNLIPKESKFNLNRHHSTVLRPGVFLRRLCSLLRFPPRVSLSLQLTMSPLFLFKEAAWVPIRQESSRVEMEAAAVHEGAIWLSPLVDFTAGPPALLAPQDNSLYETHWRRRWKERGCESSLLTLRSIWKATWKVE